MSVGLFCILLQRALFLFSPKFALWVYKICIKYKNTQKSVQKSIFRLTLFLCVSLLESFLLVESESESDEDFKPSAEIDKLPDKKAAKDVSFQTGSTYNDLILINTLFKERNEILTVIDYYDN